MHLKPEEQQSEVYAHFWSFFLHNLHLGPRIVLVQTWFAPQHTMEPPQFQFKGAQVGAGVGRPLGVELGAALGEADGMAVGDTEGLGEGTLVGVKEGSTVGAAEGLVVGRVLGLELGSPLGKLDGD